MRDVKRCGNSLGMSAKSATEFVKEYIGKLYEADLYHRVKRKEIAGRRSVTAEEDQNIPEEAPAIAREAYNQHRDASNDDWYPNSVGWPLDFDLARYSNWNALIRGETIIVSAEWPSLTSSRGHLYYLRKYGDSFKINNIIQE